jgi:hypothetical protein
MGLVPYSGFRTIAATALARRFSAALMVFTSGLARCWR